MSLFDDADAAPSGAAAPSDPDAPAPAPDGEAPLTPEEQEALRVRLAAEEDARSLERIKADERRRRRARRELDVEEFDTLRTMRRLRLIDGWEFLAEDDDADEQLWGTPGGQGGMLWAPGEPLMLFGGNGVFKSTLSHLLVFARLGLLGPDGRPRADHGRCGPEDHPDTWGAVLGMPVRPMDPAARILYLAGDRPRQIRRAMRRHRRDWMHEILREHLVVHDGPLPFDLTTDKDALADLVQEHKGADVFVDSVKDYCPKPSDDESANGYNRARQECIARGVQWVEDHHNRKIQQGQKPTNGIDDVYGSRWLTAGAGSVVSMWVDEEGSTLVHVRQVKSPGEFVPELEVTVDKASGTMSASNRLDPIARIQAAGPAGITAAEYSRYMNLSIKAARNQLATRIKQGVLEEVDSGSVEDNLKRYRTVLGVQPNVVSDVRQEDGLGKLF